MFNKLTIILSIIILVSMFGLKLMFNLYQKEKNNRKIYNNNMIALITDKARQQELTAKELKKLYPKYDSLANVLSIKTKFITNIIDIKYKFRDSILTKTVLKMDSVSEKNYFTLKEKCYTLSGYIKKDTISFTNKEFKDNLTTFLYKDWDKKYLWGLIKLRPHYRSKIYSECMSDTISVNNNIKIRK